MAGRCGSVTRGGASRPLRAAAGREAAAGGQGRAGERGVRALRPGRPRARPGAHPPAPPSRAADPDLLSPPPPLIAAALAAALRHALRPRSWPACVSIASWLVRRPLTRARATRGFRSPPPASGPRGCGEGLSSPAPRAQGPPPRKTDGMGRRGGAREGERTLDRGTGKPPEEESPGGRAREGGNKTNLNPLLPLEKRPARWDAGSRGRSRRRRAGLTDSRRVRGSGRRQAAGGRGRGVG